MAKAKAKAKAKSADRDMDADDDHHEAAFKNGGKINRGKATQRAALHKHRKNRTDNGGEDD